MSALSSSTYALLVLKKCDENLITEPCFAKEFPIVSICQNSIRGQNYGKNLKLKIKNQLKIIKLSKKSRYFVPCRWEYTRKNAKLYKMRTTAVQHKNLLKNIQHQWG